MEPHSRLTVSDIPKCLISPVTRVIRVRAVVVVRCKLSGRSPDDDTGQVIEARRVGRDDHSAGGDRGGGDDEVVGASWSPSLSYRDEECGVCTCDVEVVTDDRQAGDDVIEECLSRLSALAGGDLNAYSEFSDRDRGDGGLVVVSDQRIEVEDRSFGVDKDVGVEQQQCQNRSCTVRSSRKASISWLQA